MYPHFQVCCSKHLYIPPPGYCRDLWISYTFYISYGAQSPISGPPIKTLHLHLLIFVMFHEAERQRIWLDGLLFSISLCTGLSVFLLSCLLSTFCPTWKVSTWPQSYCVPQVKTSVLCNNVYNLLGVSSEMQQIALFGLFLWSWTWWL